MVNWPLFIALGVILGVATAMFEFPYVYAVIILVAIVIFMIVRMYYIALYSTNMKAVKKYIQKHKKEPVMNFFLQVADGTKEDEIKAIDQVISTAKNSNIKRTYEMNRAIRLQDFDLAEEIAQSISDNEYGKYGLAIIAASRGNYEEAEEYSFFTLWMKWAVQAEIAYSQKNREKYDENVQKTIDASKGVQRFVVIHNFRKAEQEQEQDW